MTVINTNAPVVVGVDQFVADVLRRAHQKAEAVHAPDEERVILHLAELFAEELAESDPQFDRVHFIQVITTDSPYKRRLTT